MIPLPEVIFEGNTVRPTDADGDVFFGLVSGTNGTGPALRRTLVAQVGLTWLCSDGRRAVGTLLIPTGNVYTENPWY